MYTIKIGETNIKLKDDYYVQEFMVQLMNMVAVAENPEELPVEMRVEDDKEN